MYWNKTQAQWIPVESYMDQNGYLVINTNHLSTWTVAEVSDTVEPPPDTTPNGIANLYLYAGIIAVVIVAAVVGVLVYLRSASNPRHQ